MTWQRKGQHYLQDEHGNRIARLLCRGMPRYLAYRKTNEGYELMGAFDDLDEAKNEEKPDAPNDNI